MKTSTVNIEASSHGHSSKARVFIDGQRLPNVFSVKTTLTVDESPIVTLDLYLPHDVKIENASIAVDDVVIPESVEQALWKYLVAKYASTTDVTMLGSKRGRVVDVTTLSVETAGLGAAINRRQGECSSSRQGDFSSSRQGDFDRASICP